MSTKSFDNLVNVTLAVCCVTVTVLSVRQQLFRPKAPPPPRPEVYAEGRPLPDGVTLVDGGLNIGSGGAGIQVVEFADFECPFCSVAAGEIEEIQKKFPGLLSIRFRHMPVAAHTNARPAAVAAECAAEQGAFEGFYYLAYRNYSDLSRRKLRKLALQAGVKDMPAFDACVESGRHNARIEADIALAKRVGVVGTPTFVVGDSVFGGVPSLAQVEGWVTGTQPVVTR